MSENRNAFLADIFDDYHQPLHRFLAKTLGSEAEAHDVAQETYIRLARVERLESLDNLRSYVFKTALNLALDRIRKVQRGTADYPRDSAEIAEVADAGPRPDTVVYHRQRLATLVAALQDLPDNCRRALLLHRLQGLTYAQIGERLGVSGDMVNKYLARATAHCRKRLQNEERGIHVHPPRANGSQTRQLP